MDYFNAMLNLRIPNIEIHLYARGKHPGDKMEDGSSMSGGLTDRNDTPYGTWQYRMIDWMKDLGFLQKPGLETQAARDTQAYVANPPRPRGAFGRGRGGSGGSGRGGAGRGGAQ
jgi:endo-1,4-beta-xylanase